MHAILETGGKQYRVAPGDVIRVEKLEGEIGSEVVLPVKAARKAVSPWTIVSRNAIARIATTGFAQALAST